MPLFLNFLSLQSHSTSDIPRSPSLLVSTHNRNNEYFNQRNEARFYKYNQIPQQYFKLRNTKQIRHLMLQKLKTKLQNI
jgi:hypothetical protein